MDMPCTTGSQQAADGLRAFSAPTERRSLLAPAFMPKHALGERTNTILVPRRRSQGRAGSDCIGQTLAEGQDGLSASLSQTTTAVPPGNLTIPHASMIAHERELMRLLDGERAAHDLLANVGRRKDEFLALLGHELRNPLSDITNAVQVLEQLSCHDSIATEMHDVVKRQSLLMTKLIDDLLDISRISCGKIMLQVARVDLVGIIRNAVLDHQHHLTTNHLTLVLDLQDAPIWVRGDALRLTQVFTNLLHNATKFTDPGGTISVGVNCTNAFAALSVRDTGIGMRSTEMAAMFEPFRQAESSRMRSKGGLGLGLALSLQLIEKHGGTIAAASEGLGCGSVFTIRLPLDRALLPIAAPPAIDAAVRPTSRRVLIVDDRRDARLTLTALLAQMNQRVMQAETGANALDIARTFHPEIVLCDIGLPDMDGHAVARAMRADAALRGVVLVALTGYGQTEDRREPLQPALIDT